MWSELWTGWMMGYEVRVPKEFDFCWATDGIDRWNHLGFFHNAGVVSSDGKFFKGLYINKTPYNEDLNISDKFASYKYWEWVKETSKTSVLI
jgi:hypothetical protein